jgi:hypothetical protein
VFDGDPDSMIERIYGSHHKVIDGSPRPSTEVYYRQTE